MKLLTDYQIILSYQKIESSKNDVSSKPYNLVNRTYEMVWQKFLLEKMWITCLLSSGSGRAFRKI